LEGTEKKKFSFGQRTGPGKKYGGLRGFSPIMKCTGPVKKNAVYWALDDRSEGPALL